MTKIQFLRCDGPSCDAEAELGKLREWRGVDAWSLDGDGENNSQKHEAHLCPTCFAKVMALLWPKTAPLPVVANIRD